MVRSLLFVSLLVGLAAAQTPGKTPEKHPKLQTWKCTKSGGCVRKNTALVLDALAHPVHQLNNANLGCGSWGSAPPKDVCPDETTCARNCIMEGISDYSKKGVVTNGGSLQLRQIVDGAVVSPRVYLLAENEQKYEMLKLTGNEFSFDVDLSNLPCGMNAALYTSEMLEDGGKSNLNTGGAAYGTGYCDAQCFTTPFVNGVGNINATGACCNEMDILESNALSQQIAPHTCNKAGLYRCSGEECQFEGVCDKNGCGYNPYSLGNKGYWGRGLKVDTNRPFKIVTQFPASQGKLTEMRRLYVQDGKVIQNAAVNVTGPPAQNFLNDDYCSKTGARRYMELGAHEGFGKSFDRGHVLVFSLWWDDSGFMRWLDSGNAGPCNATEGDPKVIRQIQPNPRVTFSEIKWGEIGSTFSAS